MVDASDMERLRESREELEQVLADASIQEVPVLVFGTKVDKRDAISEEEFRDAMDLPYHQTYGKEVRNAHCRKIEVFMISARKQVGYQEGFAWLSELIE